jgi:hypothetical protein
MSKLKASVFSAIVLFGAGLAADAFADRGHHGHYARSRVSIGVGIGGPYWYGAPYPYYYRPYYRPYYYSPYYYPYPVAAAVPAAPPVYVEQGQPAPSAPAAAYWYYCSDSEAYYPNVQQCPVPWQRVAPQPPA